MKTEIKLIRKGWVNVTQGDVSVWVRGQAHLGDAYYDTKSLAELFVGKAETVAILDELVSDLNGCWAAVVQFKDCLFVSVDRIRSIQVLYSVDELNNELIVFDDVEEYRKTHAVDIDEDGCHEYLSFGYVYSDRTLYKNIFSLQAAERIVLSNLNSKWQKESRRYWRFVPVEKNEIKPSEELFKKIDAAFVRMIERLIESVNGRRIVIPLSGGYDSRIIANYLHRLGYKNVLCYTYGSQPSVVDGVPNEPECSRRVAEALGYEWHFTEYSKKNSCSILNNTDMIPWYKYMVNGNSKVCFQEYVALNSMREKRLVNSDDIITPGHNFDFIAGSCMYTTIPVYDLAAEVQHFGKQFLQRGEWKRSMQSTTKLIKENSVVPYKSFYESFLWQEETAKFVINAVRCYEWLGFDWRLPEWDNDLIQLWMSLPVALRFGRGYFKSIWPKLAEPEIRECPIYGTATIWEAIKHAISSRMPYPILHAIHWLRRKAEFTPIKYTTEGIDISDAVEVIMHSKDEALESVRTRIAKNLPRIKHKNNCYIAYNNLSVTLKAFGMSI